MMINRRTVELHLNFTCVSKTISGWDMTVEYHAVNSVT